MTTTTILTSKIQRYNFQGWHITHNKGVPPQLINKTSPAKVRCKGVTIPPKPRPEGKEETYYSLTPKSGILGRFEPFGFTAPLCGTSR